MTAPPGPRLENRLPAEGLHGPDEHPLRELSWLLLASAVVLAAAVLLVGWGAQWLAPRLPFSAEVALAERLVDSRQPPATAADAARRAELQALADRVAAAMDLPPGMRPVLGDEASPMVNAYATLGGRIRVYHGLLARLDSEEALAALLAHEIAHVRHRHVAANLGRGLALSLLLGVVSSDAGAAAGQAVLGEATLLALLGYSREQEAQADAEALRASIALYGHAGGLLQVFQRLAIEDGRTPIELLRSHPLTATRLTAVKAAAAANGWALEGPLRPLPAALRMPGWKP